MNKLYLCFVSLLTAICISNSAYGATLQGKVVGVSDGDTITVLTEGNMPEKVRLVGIDAPEKRQPYGEKSKLNLSRLVFGKFVEVDWSHKDRYGRIIGKVLVSQSNCSSKCPSLDAGLSQIEVGLAWHYKQYQSEQTANDRVAYSNAEREARQQKVGLWAELSPTPPWSYRRNK